MSRSGRRGVVIVGAGVAGLTLAASLDPARFDVTLIEAQPQRTTGAALGLWAGARRVLDGLGVELDAVGDARVRVHRVDGSRIVTLPSPDVAQVLRPALMAGLSAALPATVTCLSGQVDDPRALLADPDVGLVVGADGVRSRVRALVWPRAAERVVTPWFALRGMAAERGLERAVQGVPAVDARVANEFWGLDRLFGDAPAPGGRYWFTAHRSALGPEPLDAARVIAEARTVFAADDARITARLDAAGADTLATRLWVAAPLPRYVRGRFVVIGDAAHGALPNLGRGASDAVLDAASLAATLNGGGSLAAWQARRVPVTQGARLGAHAVMGVATSRLLDRASSARAGARRRSAGMAS